METENLSLMTGFSYNNVQNVYTTRWNQNGQGFV